MGRSGVRAQRYDPCNKKLYLVNLKECKFIRNTSFKRMNKTLVHPSGASKEQRAKFWLYVDKVKALFGKRRPLLG
jgi:hypothetical protein